MKDFIVKNGKEMRYGYTTGSCAAAASAGALTMLLSQLPIKNVDITLPDGRLVEFALEDIEIYDNYALCSVTKDAGDDPDVTDKAKIFARVSLAQEGISITGGKGVGKVTVKGLQIPVGESAINPVPRQMILQNSQRILQHFNTETGLSIEISVPNGEEIAKKTFNPRLGIMDGISILGTTGIVEPMSEKALIDTIKLLADKQYSINPNTIVISPGNYGEDYCRKSLGLDIGKTVKCSNFIGETLDYIRYKGFKNVLLVGHLGKLVKMAGSIMNTHSAVADCRMELIALQCALNGAKPPLLNQILQCITTEQAFDLIYSEPFYENVKSGILERTLFHANFRLKGEVNFAVIMFNLDGTHIIKSGNSDAMLQSIKEEDDER